MKSSKLLCILSALATALLVLSASVAAPILCRPFYYAHIAPLELTRYGLPAEEIRRAYGEMMDYCLGLRPDFAAGVLPASPERTSTPRSSRKRARTSAKWAAPSGEAGRTPAAKSGRSPRQ